jgi:hypothetical protein
VIGGGGHHAADRRGFADVAASSGLREAAAVALTHSPTTLKTARSLDDLLAVLANADRVTRLRATVAESL